MLTDPRLISDRVERRPGRYRLGQRATAHDTLSLGSEADALKALTLSVGIDVINGFNVGINVIDFSVADKLQGWTGGKSATDLLASATMSGGCTFISLDGHNAITLKGVALGKLTVGNSVT